MFMPAPFDKIIVKSRLGCKGFRQFFCRNVLETVPPVAATSLYRNCVLARAYAGATRFAEAAECLLAISPECPKVHSVYGLFAAWMQSDFRLSLSAIATPVLLSNLLSIIAYWFWVALADRIGRRWTSAIQAVSGCIVAPFYLLTGNIGWIIGGFLTQGFFGPETKGQIFSADPARVHDTRAVAAVATVAAA
jgi:hypothetical protein